MATKPKPRRRSPPKLTPLQELTAAVMSVPEQALERMPRNAMAWQTKAWRLWSILGVLHYPTSFMADQVARVDWDVTVDGTELEPEAAAKAIDAVTAGIGAAEAARLLALNLEVAGEVYYGRKDDVWMVVASNAPKKTEKLKGMDPLVRAILADPVDPDKPDSPVRAAIDVAEEIRVMSALSRSQDRNRMAQRGILLIPKEGQFPEGDDFKAKFEAAVTAPIADEYAASAVVPPIVEFPAEFIESWRHLVMEFPYDDKLHERIDNAIRRLALSLNMPPEVLLGNLDSNHWNAWISEESTYRAHVEPLAVIVGSVFAQAMMLAAPGSGLIEVTPDPSELLARRQSVADAFDALRLGVVGFDYVRKQMGADDDDAPSDDELRIIALMVHGASAAAELSPGGSASTTREPPALPQRVPTPSSSNGSREVTAAVEADSDRELDALGRQLSDLDMHLRSKLVGAVEMAVENAREKVGSEGVGAQERVASHMKRLGTMWARELRAARRSLRELGLNAEGAEWEQAAAQSVDVLVDGVTDYAVAVLDLADSEVPALPGDLLRRVVAVAGGSETVTVAAAGLPPPTTQDALGFGVGTLSTKALRDEGLIFQQWRFRYGDLTRERPFHPHKEVDGRYASADGEVQGLWPGDHKGCLCGLTPEFRRVEGPQPV